MLTNTLFACASLVAAAVAQTSRIAFTVLPTNVTAGKPVTLQWGGGDGSVSFPALRLLKARGKETVVNIFYRPLRLPSSKAQALT